jgi:DNA-binding NarL/FixJ family response regulator
VARSAPARVLIVDDNEAFRRVAKAVVESMEGFAVVGEADSGESAVSLASNVRPDLVLMDVNLQGIDGIEATRRILARSPRVVVMLLSTYEASAFAARMDMSGTVAYVYKGDFGPERLAQLWSALRAS